MRRKGTHAPAFCSQLHPTARTGVALLATSDCGEAKQVLTGEVFPIAIPAEVSKSQAAGRIANRIEEHHES
jgi:hypothetical protein